MARPRTRTLVFDAVLEMAREDPFASVTMEGVASRAGVSKQTLYRTWPSTGAIIFDALLASSVNDEGVVELPDTGDLAADLELLVSETIAELTEPTHDRLLRAVTADIQTDRVLAAEFHDRLLQPQVAAVSSRFARGGIEDTGAAAELILGPILHRWLLRTAPFEATWARQHVRRVLRAIAP